MKATTKDPISLHKLFKSKELGNFSYPQHRRFVEEGINGMKLKATIKVSPFGYQGRRVDVCRKDINEFKKHLVKHKLLYIA